MLSWLPPAREYTSYRTSSVSVLRWISLCAYYPRLMERGQRKGSALMAVMRKMLAMAAHLLTHEGETYDPTDPRSSSIRSHFMDCAREIWCAQYNTLS